MSYTPIPFVNDVAPYLEADNLNYMQQGIVLAVDRSKLLDDAWKDGSLKGVDGKNGADGKDGEDGKNFEIDGIVPLLEDLPTASEHTGQIWLTNQYGHLHYSDGTQWLDWGQFTGIQGEQGEKGDPFDVDDLTGAQLSALHAKLYAYDAVWKWHYKTSIVQGKTAKVPLGDLNLTLDFTNYGTGMMTYKLVPIDIEKPSTFYVKRLANYDLTAFEGTASSGYTAQAITSAGFVVDGSAYFAGREDIKIGICDPFNDFWYTIEIFGFGTAQSVLIDVQKRAVQGRINITPE